MRVNLVVVPEEGVEAVLLRNAGGVPSAASPLAEAPGRVAAVLQHRRDGRLPFAERGAPVVRAHRGVARVQTGDQVAAQWRAHRGPGVGAGEAHALLREAVDVGRADVGAHVAELEVASSSLIT